MPLLFCGFSSSLFPECAREGILLNFAAGHDSSNLPPRSRFTKEAFLISGVSEWMKYKAVRLVATGVYPCK